MANHLGSVRGLVCRQLGLGWPLEWKAATSLSYPGPQGVTQYAGVGTGQVWMSYVACTGFEERLVDCPVMPGSC